MAKGQNITNRSTTILREYIRKSHNFKTDTDFFSVLQHAKYTSVLQQEKNVNKCFMLILFYKIYAKIGT